MKSQRKDCPFEKWDDKRVVAFDCFTEIETKEKKMHLQFEKSEKIVRSPITLRINKAEWIAFAICVRKMETELLKN